MKRMVVLLLGLFMTSLPDLPAADAKEPIVGEPHPLLRFPTIDRKQTIDLRDYLGKKVVLIQFASW